jgi:hypothetical protein
MVNSRGRVARRAGRSPKAADSELEQPLDVCLDRCARRLLSTILATIEEPFGFGGDLVREAATLLGLVAQRAPSVVECQRYRDARSEVLALLRNDGADRRSELRRILRSLPGAER